MMSAMRYWIMAVTFTVRWISYKENKMKNYEKYADEIKKFDGYPDFCEQKILKPLGKSCEATDCCYCNLLKIVWLLEDYKEPDNR